MTVSNRTGEKKYIHWKEAQMVLLSEYLQKHVEYATSPSLESCFYIKRDVFPDDEEVTPKRLFGKICNVRAAFKRSGDVQDDPTSPSSKRKRRKRHSHMDSIYSQFEGRSGSHLDESSNVASNPGCTNTSFSKTGGVDSITLKRHQQQEWKASHSEISQPANNISSSSSSQASGMQDGAEVSSASSAESVMSGLYHSGGSPENMLNLVKSTLVDQLNHWKNVTNRTLGTKSPQDLLLEYLHERMEQDAELNRILIAATEQMTTFQANAQLESARLLKECSQSLGYVMASVTKGAESINDQSSSEADSEE